jgi:Zn-dependent membrane protease YugP
MSTALSKFADELSPRLFPYGVTVSALALLFLLIILILAAQRLLIPGLILLGSFILFVLWLTLLIETAIQLYHNANVNGKCETIQRQPVVGANFETLQYLTQINICNCWRAAFSFEIVGTVFFLYMMVLAWQVQRDD